MQRTADLVAEFLLATTANRANFNKSIFFTAALGHIQCEIAACSLTSINTPHLVAFADKLQIGIRLEVNRDADWVLGGVDHGHGQLDAVAGGDFQRQLRFQLKRNPRRHTRDARSQTSTVGMTVRADTECGDRVRQVESNRCFAGRVRDQHRLPIQRLGEVAANVGILIGVAVCVLANRKTQFIQQLVR